MHAIEHDAITELGCWTHARCKFFDTHAGSGRPGTKGAIERIGENYAIDAALRDLDPDARCRERQRLLAPTLALFKCWLDALPPKALGNTGLARANGYAP